MAGAQGEADDSVEGRLAILIRPEAASEIQEACQYYEDKSEGLGNDVLRAVEAGLASIGRSPGMYSTVYKHVKRCVLRRFPYSLFYVVEESRIVIIACFHGSRNPRQWKKRL